MEPHEANRAFWDRSVEWWREKEDARGLWRRAHEDPALVLSPDELRYVSDVAGRSVAVLGSGDNEVAFALTGLGARVTSVDISQRRLDVAAERARTLGLALTFLRADVTDLSALADGTFDLVYTGGHMSVWVSDIGRYYAEGVRILKPGGLFVVNDYHPVRRMWLGADGPEPKNRYFDRGPYRYDEGGQTSYEYHWTVADHLQAVIDAGCRLIAVAEHTERIDDEFWLSADLSHLPAYLLVVGQKDGDVCGACDGTRQADYRSTTFDRGALLVRDLGVIPFPRRVHEQAPRDHTKQCSQELPINRPIERHQCHARHKDHDA